MSLIILSDWIDSYVYEMIKLNKDYAYIIHKYYSVYKYVFVIIGCMWNIRKNKRIMNKELRTNDTWDKGYWVCEKIIWILKTLL